MTYARPHKMSEVLKLLSQSDWRILAGGTDFYPSLRERPVAHPVLDVTGVAGLRRIALENGFWRIGAAATWSDLIATDLPPAFDGLKLAAREVGSVQIQNRATLVGNICNASPAADGVPPLLTLDAEVELSSLSGIRRVALREFVTGNRETLRQSHEIVTAVLVPEHAAEGCSSFLKLGSRRYLVISIAMVACRLSANAGGRIASAAVSIGACAAVAQRLSLFESRLIGSTLAKLVDEAPTDAELQVLAPIDDVRAPASYRLTAAKELVSQALVAAAWEFER